MATQAKIPAADNDTRSDDAVAEVAALVARSRVAQAQIEHYTQEQVDALIRAMVWSVAREDVAKRHPPAALFPVLRDDVPRVGLTVDDPVPCEIEEGRLGVAREKLLDGTVHQLAGDGPVLARQRDH